MVSITAHPPTVLPVREIALELRIRFKLVQKSPGFCWESVSKDQSFSIGTSRGRVQTAIEGREIGVSRAVVTRIQAPVLHQDLLDLAGLLAELQGVSEPGVIGLVILRVVIHRDHILLGLLEGIGHGGESRSEMLQTAFEVFILALEAVQPVGWARDTVGDQAFDEFLDTVAVLEGVDHGLFLVFGESFWKLKEEEKILYAGRYI